MRTATSSATGGPGAGAGAGGGGGGGGGGIPWEWIIKAGGGLASLIGGLFGHNSSSTSSTTPTLAPQYSPLEQLVLGRVQARLQNPTGLPAGYATGGIRQINSTYDTIDQTLANRLTERGLASSPVAGAAEAKLQVSRAGDIGTFRANLPLVERQLQNEDLNAAAGLLSQARGSTTSATSTTGGGAAGGFSDLATYIGYLYGTGQLGGANKYLNGGANTNPYTNPYGGTQ
jgi:hypothetical protein